MILVPLVLYLDATWLSTNGMQTRNLFSMTIGNIERSIMNKHDEAKRLIGYMPTIAGHPPLPIFPLLPYLPPP